MRRWVACAAMLSVLSGCGAFTALLGEGAMSVVENRFESDTARTFARPMDAVRAAVRSAVIELGFEVSATDATGPEQSLTARHGDRAVEVSIERITEKATRISVLVKQGLDYDYATARRIAEGVSTQLETRKETS